LESKKELLVGKEQSKSKEENKHGHRKSAEKLTTKQEVAVS
jgi:hypothetical protein